MKNILYIGNLQPQKDSIVTTIDTLSKSLSSEGYIVFSKSKKHNKVLRFFDMLFGVLKYKGKTDYVLIDTYSTLNFYYAFAVSQLCRFFKLKYIPILHGGNLPNRLIQSPRLSKAIFNNAWINIAPSLFIKSSFEKLGYYNVKNIPNSIELKNYPFKKRKNDKLKLLWVRSFSEIYNPLLAIDVLKSLKDDRIDVELCMVGPDKDGSLQKAKAYAKQLAVDVRFTGKLSKKEWISLSEGYNVFINTTNIDNMPVSVIEAMALGLPVISANVGGIPFLLKDGINGVMVDPNNVAAFKNALLSLFYDNEKANEIATAARKQAEQFDWGCVKNKWFEILS